MLKLCTLRLGLVWLLIAVGQGCAGPTPGGVIHAQDDHDNSVVAAARRAVGAPYRYGGFTPRGFDCSGLVYYAYRQAGISVPRTTGALLRAARPVPLDDLRAGDVLFFELEGKKVSHVGIYAGTGSFIHAPSSGKQVSYASLRSEFWRSHLTAVGRFY
jgi:probable lipoprotein NlpC